MTAPVVSVIMPVYNAEKYLEQAVRSILCQTFTDFEFIIIDDGSTDKSPHILERFAREPRINLVKRENRGLVQSLNEGISRARGQWIARMDADDISRPDRFEKQLAWIDKTGAELCGGNVRLFGSGISRILRYCESDEAIKIQLLFNSAFAHPAVMINRRLIQRHPYDSQFAYAEDYELWARLAVEGVRMTNCQSIVLDYRLHHSQLSRQKNKMQLEARNACARRYWASYGIEFPLESLERFQSITEAEGLMSAVMSIPIARDHPAVVASGIWSIAIRSAHLGMKLWNAIHRFGLLPRGVLQGTSLFCLCALQPRPDGPLFEVMAKLR